MINTLLIANRGEIACRIIRTARKLGIRTVAVYAEPDQQALHVEQSDIAVALGGTATQDNYLNAEMLIEAAKATHCDAIHPGYGFLSENADFAQLCKDAGIVFVGPSPAAIRSMGSKSAAKALMGESGVPLLPGYHGEDQDTTLLKNAADEIGYPVMLKASAGGGGKGMRIVRTANEFDEALSAVKRESLASFGDDRILIERYIPRPRHIEIQVFGDEHGNYVHLFERDCSIQRRHQKVIEEAPAPHMTPQWRDEMGSAAIAAAKAVDYVGAGTVEFIVDQEQQFFFMEMNTRLQVEHPVTEMITGVDLVEWQLHVAAGQPLPRTQHELQITGHSIEARLYAEDTDNQFLPSTGKLALLEFPPNSRSLRIETGIKQGNEISVYYDPMMAKIVSYGDTRDDAIRILLGALHSTHILGVANNAAYLSRVLSTAAFAQAQLSTAFLIEHATLIDTNTSGKPATTAPNETAAALAVLYAAADTARFAAAPSHAQNPLAKDGWRLNASATFATTLHLLSHNSNPGAQFRLNAIFSETNATVYCNDQPLSFSQIHRHQQSLYTVHDKTTVTARVLMTDQLISVRYEGREYRFTVSQLDDLAGASSSAANSMLSPMPGKVIQVLVKPGDSVEQNQPVMIIEAMKMEHTIRASKAGVVQSVHFDYNDSVTTNAQLLAIDTAVTAG